MDSEMHKRNLISIAKEHKLSCDNEYCTVSLALLLELGTKMGIQFTDEEKMEFF